MTRPHAHHILFKKGRGKTQRELVQRGQAILEQYGIDPVFGFESLGWAPNVQGQHTTEALRGVVEAIEAVHDRGGSRQEMVEALRQMGDVAAAR
jgi:hypothetical protein